MNQNGKSWWPSLLIGTWAAVFTVLPVKAAQRIDLTYGPFVFPVSVKELEIFAEEGKIEPGLEPYLKRLSPAGRSQLRKLLRSPYDVDAVTVSRITHTVSGTQVLRYIGGIIKSPSGRNGFYGLRAAAVLAAGDSEGLSVINFLRQFPTNIKIDIRQVLKLVAEISTPVRKTQQSIAKLKQISSEMAAAETPVKGLPDPRSPGKFDSDKQTIQLLDKSRDLELIVDLYLPKGSRQDTWPVIIISNGLGGKRDRFI